MKNGLELNWKISLTRSNIILNANCNNIYIDVNDESYIVIIYIIIVLKEKDGI